jgi:type II secretory pathway pseudopilin PulG
MRRRVSGGISLVELVVIAVIIVILTAVAIPLMSANRARARADEAESRLGAIRRALKVMQADTSAFNRDLNGNAIGSGNVVGVVPGIQDGDLDGRWFSDESYVIADITASNFAVKVNGSVSTAPESDEVVGVVITMDQDGRVKRSGL